MIYGIKTVLKYALGIDIAGRNFAVYPDDTFVVSYPRSGNTWTRFLIANLVHPEKEVSFTNIEQLIPDTSSQSNRALKATPRPRIIKTHEYFDHRYPKTIYIVRDPRDVALSYYDFQRKYMWRRRSTCASSAIAKVCTLKHVPESSRSSPASLILTRFRRRRKL